MSATEIELNIKPDGTVELPWWTPQIEAYICDLCGSQGTEKCRAIDVNGTLFYLCSNKNPYCG